MVRWMRASAPLLLFLSIGGLARADKHTDRLEKHWKQNRQLSPLLDALRAPDKMVRRAAAQVLGETADPNAVEPLIGALRDSYASTRAMAASSLRTLADARAVAPLCAALKVETDAATASFMLDALEKLRAPESDAAILEALRAPDPGIRASAAKVVGRIPLGQAADLLAALVIDSSPEVRHAAATALLRIDEARGLAALDGAVQHADPKLRLTAQNFLKGADTRNKPSQIARGRKITLLGVERAKSFGDYPLTYSAKRGFELAIVRARTEILDGKASGEILEAELVDERDQTYKLAQAIGGGFHFQMAVAGEKGERATLTFAIAVPVGAELRTLRLWDAAFSLETAPVR